MECLFGTYPIKVTILSGVIGFSIIQFSFKINKRKLEAKDFICEIVITILNKRITVNGYVDSGNTLKDPITNQDVIIVETSEIKKIIDTENMTGCDIKEKFRIIPFKSIGKQNGMLYRDKSR